MSALLPHGHKTKTKFYQNTQLVHLSLKTQQKYCSEQSIQLQLTLQSMTALKETFQIVKHKIIFFPSCDIKNQRACSPFFFGRISSRLNRKDFSNVSTNE